MARTVEINQAAVVDFVAGAGDGPIVMLNLLRFRAQADYGSRTDVTPCTGREAYYERYASVAASIVADLGVQVRWVGSVIGALVAPADEQWDEVLIAEYPNPAAFQALSDHPEYRAIVFHRTAALSDSRLIATRDAAFAVSAKT